MPIIESLAKLPDQTLAFLCSGYLFQGRVRAARGLEDGSRCPVPLTLLGKNALLVRGREGIELFYDQSKVKREKAMPLPVRGPLFGEGAVHGLDGEEHAERKAMMVAITYEDEQVRRFMPYVEAEQRKMLDSWAAEPSTVYASSVLVYGRAILRWAGVPGADAELDPWARRLAQIVEGFGHKGPEHVLAWVNRRRCDAWAADLVERTRAGEITPRPGSSLDVVSHHRLPDGALLDVKTAGVELQNTTRPCIAVARFAAFAAKALVELPGYRARIAAEVAERGTLLENPLAVAFAQEVRRTSPFVPMLPAFATCPFEFQGAQVAEGDRVLLDVFGTDMDPEEWDEPMSFRPERFLDVDAEQIPAFIPQGGAEVGTGHRCPGEKIAVTALAVTVAGLCTPGVQISPVGLEVDPTRLPTMPRSGAHVRVRR